MFSTDLILFRILDVFFCSINNQTSIKYATFIAFFSKKYYSQKDVANYFKEKIRNRELKNSSV